MAEADILLLLVKGLAVLLAVGLFIRFLCDEYLRALEFRGLIRRRCPVIRPGGGLARPKKAVTKKAP